MTSIRRKLVGLRTGRTTISTHRSRTHPIARVPHPRPSSAAPQGGLQTPLTDEPHCPHGNRHPRMSMASLHVTLPRLSRITSRSGCGMATSRAAASYARSLVYRAERANREERAELRETSTCARLISKLAGSMRSGRSSPSSWGSGRRLRRAGRDLPSRPIMPGRTFSRSRRSMAEGANAGAARPQDRPAALAKAGSSRTPAWDGSGKICAPA